MFVPRLGELRRDGKLWRDDYTSLRACCRDARDALPRLPRADVGRDHRGLTNFLLGLITSLLGCNTAPIPMVCSEGAKSAMYYMIKYVTKDAAAVQESLALLHTERLKKVLESWTR